MVHDLVIKNGTLIDGSGSEPIRADIIVNDGRITRIGNCGSVEAVQEIDATDRIVTPGFIDAHTHLDAQVGWDPALTPSSYHGITTVLVGNCGVTFAPVSPGNEPKLAEIMEGVEDISAKAIMTGLPWSWTGYGGYLDAVQKLKPALNIVGLVGHAAVRYDVMGDRAIDHDAVPTGDEIRETSPIAFVNRLLRGPLVSRRHGCTVMLYPMGAKCQARLRECRNCERFSRRWSRVVAKAPFSNLYRRLIRWVVPWLRF